MFLNIWVIWHLIFNIIGTLQWSLCILLLSVLFYKIKLRIRYSHKLWELYLIWRLTISAFKIFSSLFIDYYDNIMYDGKKKALELYSTLRLEVIYYYMNTTHWIITCLNNLTELTKIGFTCSSIVTNCVQRVNTPLWYN